MELEGKGLSNYDKRVLIWTSNEFSYLVQVPSRIQKAKRYQKDSNCVFSKFLLLKTSTEDPLSFGVMAVVCDGRLILLVDVGYNESM